MYERTNILLIAFNSILKKNLSYTFRSNDSNHKLVRQVNFLVSLHPGLHLNYNLFFSAYR